jgi:hypothetical protein
MGSVRRGESPRAVFDVSSKTFWNYARELKGCVRRDAGRHTRDGCAPLLPRELSGRWKVKRCGVESSHGFFPTDIGLESVRICANI